MRGGVNMASIKDESEFKLKDIQKIVNENGISEEKVELAKLMARRYFCNVSECIKLMLPPGTTTKIIAKKVAIWEMMRMCV